MSLMQNKSSLFHSRILMAFLVFVFTAGYAAAASNDNMFEEGKGRDDVSIAVLPTQLDNADDVVWAKSVIPDQISDSLRHFSAMEILSRSPDALAQIQKELTFQLTHGSESNSPRLGEFKGGDYFITSKITKVGRSVYYLYLEFIQLQNAPDGKVKPSVIASSNMEISRDDLRESAVKIALSTMFPDMGVILTTAGSDALLKGVQISKVKARAAIATAENAEYEGNSFDALFYKNKAAQLDASVGKSFKKKVAEDDDILGVGTGTAIADDAANQKRWNENILKMEQLFVDHPPFELYYTPNPRQLGITDYYSQTVNLEFVVSLRKGVDFKVTQSMLKDVTGGLKKTGNQKKWGFEGWPQQPIPGKFNVNKIPHFEGMRQYLVTAELVDDRDETVQSQTFPLYVQLLLKDITIGSDATQRLRVVFPNVPVKNTSNTHVKIVSINGHKVTGNTDESRETSDASKFISVVPVKRIPSKQSPSIPKDNRKVPEIAQFPGVLPPPPSAPVESNFIAVESLAADALAEMDSVLDDESGAAPIVRTLTLAELAKQQQELAMKDEIARQQQELARQQEDFQRQQELIKQRQEIERQKEETNRKQKEAELAAIQYEIDRKNQIKQNKKDARAARRQAVPLHNRFGLSALYTANHKSLNDTMAVKGEMNIGILNFTLEGFILYPFKQDVYIINSDDASGKVTSFGGGAGYTYFSKYFLGTLTVGVDHWKFLNDTGINMPYGQIELDVVPWKKGLGLRLGYTAEIGSDKWGSGYEFYLRDAWTYKTGELRLLGRFEAGLVLWL